jgi:hypothetical protein
MSMLPSNAGPFEIAAAASTDILMKLGASADLISRFKSVPGDPVLPFLIWEYGLGEIQPYMIDARRVIKEGVQWQRLRGTPAALRMAFSWIGQDVEIEEDSGAYWATYQLGLPQIASPEEVRRVLHLARLSQPARCRLWRIYTQAFDRRPIIISEGPVLGDGWLSFYSGIPVDGSLEEDTEGVLVSFGVRNAWQAERYAPDDIIGSFGSSINLSFLAPYPDRFIVGRSSLSQPYPRGHGFVMSSLFSILWADRATTGRSWRGLWDGRNWREYTGFDRKLPRWNMRQRSQSRSQLVPGWGEKLSDSNARLGASFAVVIDKPGRLGDFALSAHDPERCLLRLHEMFSACRSIQAPTVEPQVPQSAGAACLTQLYALSDTERGRSAVALDTGFQTPAYRSLAAHNAICLDLPVLSTALEAGAAPPLGVRSYLAPTWSGTWTQPGRTWNSVTELNAL